MEANRPLRVTPVASRSARGGWASRHQIADAVKSVCGGRPGVVTRLTRATLQSSSDAIAISSAGTVRRSVADNLEEPSCMSRAVFLSSVSSM